MKVRYAILSLAVLVAVAFARTAVAVNVDFGSGPSLPEGTIDQAAHAADVIVRGTVTSTKDLVFTVHVDEILKGPRTESLELWVDASRTFDPNTAWVRNGGEGQGLFFLVAPEKKAGGNTSDSPLLVYVGKSPRYDSQAWALPLAPAEARQRPRPIDCFGVRHDSPESILAATRDAVRAKVVSPKPIEIYVPNTDFPGYSEKVETTIDTRYEAVARRWVRDGRNVTSALQVLAYFPSDENAALITPLLHDRMSWDHKWATRTYPLRQHAYEVLTRAYGRTAPAPDTQETTAYRPIFTNTIASGVTTAALLFIAIMLVRRRFLLSAAALSAGGFVLVFAALLVREQTAHEVVMSARGDTYELGSYPDGLRATRREKWPAHVPLSYGDCDVASPDGVWLPPEFRGAVKRDRALGVRVRSGNAQYYRSGGPHWFDEVTIPHWLALVVLALLPAAWFIRWLVIGPRRRTARKAKGLCIECGYDVRFNTGGRCPECGVAVPAPTPPPASASHIAGSASCAPPG